MTEKEPSVSQGRIAATLRTWIQEGTYPIGSRLPTEEALCEMFEASRYSMRQALQSLSDEGLIIRRPRAGSTVIAKVGRTHLIQRVSSIQEILNYGGETERKHLASDYVVADEKLACQLRCNVGASWFRIQALRYLKGSPVPLCHTDIYLLPEYAGIIRHKKHTSMMIVDQIAEMFGRVSESTRIDITADSIQPEIATSVQAQANSPALNVIRRYSDEKDITFEVTISVHPAERHTYSFLLKREFDGKRALG